jgi:parallel beta-helix repeat protein
VLEEGEGVGRTRTRLVSGVLAILLFATLFGTLLNATLVWGSGTIYIRVDGSVDPHTAPIQTSDNTTYTFLGNINESIIIERDNVVIDGAGFAVHWPEPEGGGQHIIGISIAYRSNVTIKNVTVEGWWHGIAAAGILIRLVNNTACHNRNGIYVCAVERSAISGNLVENNTGAGIYMYYSSNSNVLENNLALTNKHGFLLDSSGGYFCNNTFRNNRMFNNTYDFMLSGLGQISDNNIDLSNIAGGKPIYYIENTTNGIYDMATNAAAFYFINSENITVRDINVTCNGVGIYLHNTSNSRIHNVIIQDCYYGILEHYSSNNMLCQCSISGCEYCGLLLRGSFNNTLRENRMDDNQQSFGIQSGWILSDYVHDIDVSNTVSGRPIYYWVDKDHSTVPGDAGFVGLINCSNIVVDRLNLTGNYQGLLMAYTKDSEVSGCSLEHNVFGIYTYKVSNTSVVENLATHNWNGICLDSTTNTTVAKNIVEYQGIGIMLFNSSDDHISQNIMEELDCGMSIDTSDNNSVSANHFANNDIAIELVGTDNRIFHNNFIGNTVQVGYLSGSNSWDDGYPSGGNYWDDYSGVDLDHDGVGDTPYTIDDYNEDRYPLMGSWTGEGQNVSVTPLNGLSIVFEEISSPGVTIANETETGHSPPLGFKLLSDPPKYYDIETTASFGGAIDLEIEYVDVGLTEAEEMSLKLMQWNDTLQQWNDITQYVDVENNIIYGETHHLSLFGVYIPPIHNLAISNVKSAKGVVGEGYELKINITVANEGDFTETFNVTLYANTTASQTKTITLSSGNSTAITFTWNTTDFALGNYTISAYSEPVSGETYTADNTFIYGTTTVTIPGDVDGDFNVTILDVVKITCIYALKQGDPGFNPSSDIDNDGNITILDVVICTSHYAQKYP